MVVMMMAVFALSRLGHRFLGLHYAVHLDLTANIAHGAFHLADGILWAFDPIGGGRRTHRLHRYTVAADAAAADAERPVHDSVDLRARVLIGDEVHHFFDQVDQKESAAKEDLGQGQVRL